jgi:hypothetical protein
MGMGVNELLTSANHIKGPNIAKLKDAGKLLRHEKPTQVYTPKDVKWNASTGTGVVGQSVNKEAAARDALLLLKQKMAETGKVVTPQQLQQFIKAATK